MDNIKMLEEILIENIMDNFFFTKWCEQLFYFVLSLRPRAF